jgi:hypothetical protein
MKQLILFAALAAAFGAAHEARAQAAKTEAEVAQVDANKDPEFQKWLAEVKAKNPGMQVVDVDAKVVRTAVLAAPPPPPPEQNPKIAIFIKNNTRVPGMDDEVDGVRDRLAAELAGAGLTVLDKAEIADGFTRLKVTAAEEKAGLVDGLLTGASTVRVGQMLGCDYILVGSINRASHTQRMAGDKPVTVYSLTVTWKLSEAANGASVDGGNWPGKLPVPGQYTDGGDALNYYSDLVDQWVTATAGRLAERKNTWRRAAAADAVLVEFTVSTTLDQLVNGLENGVRAPNELLDEMRRLVGGATVFIDGLAVGGSPGTFKAAPGIHTLRVEREWMKPFEKPVNIAPGASFNIALELSDAGLARYKSLEGFRAGVAVAYAEAAWRKGIKVNFDTAAWRDVSVNSGKATAINVTQ